MRVLRSFPLAVLVLLPAAIPGLAAAAPEPHPAAEPQDWLAEVKPLIGPEEREAYLALDPERREAFRERFWAVRDPYPATSINEMKERWDARRGEAVARWGDRSSDPRFRIHLLHGAPDAIDRPRCGGAPIEIWSWDRSELLAQPFRLAFRVPAEGDDAELLSPASIGSERPECVEGVLDWAAAEPGLLAAIRPDPGWVPDFLAETIGPPAGGREVQGDLSIRVVPDGVGDSRTTVRMGLGLPAAAFPPRPRDGGAIREILLDGEILRGEAVHDRFRYRFEVPDTDADAETFELAVERPLQPGPYRLRIRARDVEGPAFFLADEEFVVPTNGTANEALRGEAAPMVRIHPLPDAPLTGTVRVTAEAAGTAVERVRFDLDGREVLSKHRPPYSVELDLGDRPRRRTVRAVALDVEGRELARDAIELNVGPHRFAIRLVAPRPGRDQRPTLRAVAVVEVPRGERLDRVELFLDETRLATLYGPPFVQPLPAVPIRPLSYVRAVAYLEGGASAEDLVFLSAPPDLDAVDIQMVELYTTVLDRRGRPVSGLGPDAFQVLEDGREQQILRFAVSQDVPLHAGILLDTSTSMAERIDEAERAALGFLHQILEERDRAAVITFDDEPRLRVPFTNRKEVLAGGLADLAVRGETALYDSLVYALYYFSGLRGKRILLLLSDGEDVSSGYDFDDALELARRSGVAIYTVGIAMPSSDVQPRSVLMRLASETGGRAFFVDRAGGLIRVLGTIEEELRAQYLLAYQSDAADTDRYRAVEVLLDDPDLEARTLSGYYP